MIQSNVAAGLHPKGCASPSMTCWSTWRRACQMTISCQTSQTSSAKTSARPWRSPRTTSITYR